MTEKKKRYLIPVIAALAVAVGYASSRGLFKASSASELFGAISDGFFSAAVMIGGVGLISLAGKYGTFDMLSYGTRSFLGNFVKSLRDSTPKSFYQYKENKDEDGRKWLPEFAIVGGACLIIGIAALGLYFVVS